MDIPKGKQGGDFVYKDTPQKKLTLTFLPPINEKYEKAPVYFVIPGGGWHTAERQSVLDFSAKSVETLRKEGFAAFSIDYRVCKDGAVMREMITDCFDAARYIAHFADVFSIDKDSFVLSGHSAGAHLALMLSYAPQGSFKDNYEFSDEFKVKCVAAMSPPTILYDDNTNNLRDMKDAFSGCDTREERELTSPITYVSSSCPATLLCAGTSDYLVFSTSSEKLYKKLEEKGVPCKIVLSIGGGHIFERIHKAIEPNIDIERIQDIITDFAIRYAKD